MKFKMETILALLVTGLIGYVVYMFATGKWKLPEFKLPEFGLFGKDYFAEEPSVFTKEWVERKYGTERVQFHGITETPSGTQISIEEVLLAFPHIPYESGVIIQEYSRFPEWGTSGISPMATEAHESKRQMELHDLNWRYIPQ